MSYSMSGKIKLQHLKALERAPHGTLAFRSYLLISIGIFGSYVRGEQTKESDLDMLVEFDAPVGFFKFIEVHRS